MKILSKIIISISLFLLIMHSTFAAEISLSADKTTGTTDDIFKIHLSVDGEIDNGQVAIEGLEKFDIVGRQSSSQVQIINGKTTSVQEKILSLKAKEAGTFSITALAQENGDKIESSPLSFEIKKSLIQETKENLLKDSLDTNSEEIDDNILNLSQNDTNTDKEIDNFAPPTIKDFPNVQHLSAFNSNFWLQFFGIILLIGLICLLVIKNFSIFKKNK